MNVLNITSEFDNYSNIITAKTDIEIVKRYFFNK